MLLWLCVCSQMYLVNDVDAVVHLVVTHMRGVLGHTNNHHMWYRIALTGASNMAATIFDDLTQVGITHTHTHTHAYIHMYTHMHPRLRACPSCPAGQRLPNRQLQDTQGSHAQRMCEQTLTCILCMACHVCQQVPTSLMQRGLSGHQGSRSQKLFKEVQAAGGVMRTTVPMKSTVMKISVHNRQQVGHMSMRARARVSVRVCVSVCVQAHPRVCSRVQGLLHSTLSERSCRMCKSLACMCVCVSPCPGNDPRRSEAHQSVG